MINKDFDGQMDFLGLISEYTDDQGAVVRVREPGVRRSKPIAPPEPEQLTMELTVEEGPHPSPSVTPVSSPTRSVPNTVHRTVAPPQVGGRLEKKSLKTSTEGVKLFPECGKCWCRDCRHNSRNEGVPKEIGTIHMACPACSSCEEEGRADICEIGNAIEGCRTRAIEEGILIPEGEVIG